MTIITLTTDFGLGDGYVGVMKGVILSIAGPVARDIHLVDLSHEVAPQNVRQAAYILAHAAPYFPPGTVHLAVVDPGVGSQRRALVVRVPGRRETGRPPMTATEAPTYYVGPDNGLFSAALAEPGAEAFVLDRPQHWNPVVSRTFHGRDLFAPVAARLATGLTAEELGSHIADPLRLSVPVAARSAGQLEGEVIYVDRFGNLITNIPGDWTADGAWLCRVAGRTIAGLSESYAAVARSALVAVVSSGGAVEIAVRDGSAAATLNAGIGASVTLSRAGVDPRTTVPQI